MSYQQAAVDLVYAKRMCDLMLVLVAEKRCTQQLLAQQDPLKITILSYALLCMSLPW